MRISRKTEAKAALPLKRFLPTRRCKWHPDSEFYTSAVICVACQTEFKNSASSIAKRAAYWEANKHKYNRRKVTGEVEALAKLIELVNSGVEYPDAEWRVSEAFEVDADLLRAAYDESCK